MDNLLIEVRYAEDATRQSPGRLTGTLLTYGEQLPAIAGNYSRLGRWKWDDGGIVINEQHVTAARNDHLRTRCHSWTATNVRIDAPHCRTPSIGRDAAVNVRDGLLTGL